MILFGYYAVKIGIVALRAGVRGVAFNNAGGFYNCTDFKIVSCCRKFLLGNKDFTTDGAMLALGETGFGAGGSLSFVNHFGVTGGVDYFLLDKDFAASSTVFAFGKTGFGAGRLDRLIYNDVLMRFFNDIVIENISAGFTGVRGIAVNRTSRLYNDNLKGMTGCGNVSRIKNFMTDGALNVFCSAG